MLNRQSGTVVPGGGVDLLMAQRAVLVLLSVCPLVTGAPPPSAASEENETCFDCHSDEDLERENGESVFVEEDVFAASVHGGLDCIDCQYVG